MLLVALCVLVIALKCQDMNLPKYWDEAFPYSYAIGYMSEAGPSLRADAAPTHYTRGHPLLYHFLQATWNKVAGGRLWVERLLPLLFSLLSVVFTFLLGKKLFNASVGIGAAALLVVQNTFLAQAAFQLPESLLMLTLLGVLYFYVTEKMGWMTVLACCFLFTKEPAVILLALLFVYHFFIRLRRESLVERIGASWYFVVPVALNLLFFLDQYSLHGWLLFPEHTGLVSLAPAEITNRLSRYFTYLFIYVGRNGLFFLSLICTGIIVYKSRATGYRFPKGHHVSLMLILLIGFLLFSSINFYSNRYMLCMFPLISLLASAAFYYAKPGIKLLHPLLVVVTSVTCLYFSLTNLKDSDHSMGYSNAVRTQLAAIRFLKAEVDCETPIATTHLMQENMRIHYPDYVTPEEAFTGITKDINGADWMVFSSNESYFKPEDLSGLTLVKRYEEGQAWCEVFRRAY